MSSFTLIVNKNLLTSKNRALPNIVKRCLSNAAEETKRQVELFNNEKQRQRGTIGRIEKIQIQYEGPPEETTFIMNKGISTPFDCAKHMTEQVIENSTVALLNNDTLWHMHKPLPDSCTLKFLNYKIAQPYQVNRIFWRTCSFLLGAVASNSFKDKVNVNLHSFPSPNVKSGSFVYDVQLSLDDWKPTKNELKVLSLEMIKFCQNNYPIECLDVSEKLALEIFNENPHKSHQIPDIAANNNGKITLFKAGDHIDISKGPMAPNTNHVGRVTVANVIKLTTDIPGGPIYRFQGVALPKTIILNHYAFSLLEERARELNPARVPGVQENVEEDHSFAAQVTQ